MFNSLPIMGSSHAEGLACLCACSLAGSLNRLSALSPRTVPGLQSQKHHIIFRPRVVNQKGCMHCANFGVPTSHGPSSIFLDFFFSFAISVTDLDKRRDWSRQRQRQHCMRHTRSQLLWEFWFRGGSDPVAAPWKPVIVCIGLLRRPATGELSRRLYSVQRGTKTEVNCWPWL